MGTGKVGAQPWRKQNPEKWRAWCEKQRFKKYGLVEQDYYAMLWFQDEVCAICALPFTATPHIDHDHSTGSVRGLLCANCNTALGKFRDDPKVLRRAITYLSKRK